MKFLNGYKTIIGGVLAILTGLTAGVAALSGLANGGEFHLQPFVEAFGIVAGGFAALGIGGKIEKNTAAVKENTEAVAEK